ncbi:uncharacterized protein LOC116029213 [Ipomoea triloba]|uniref:uncharacterized protein LOC116029213 n=1 Tax=Ipomoea triloba TaxID=35885 RepID=UPI00125E208E|nr:uncharacterized protein LOC116029213 [Ipomoea triloba]
MRAGPGRHAVGVGARWLRRVGKEAPIVVSNAGAEEKELVGAGSNPRTVREVLGLVSSKQPEVVFLMETKVGKRHVERLRVRLGFEGAFCVEPVGLSGGLAMLWRCNNVVTLLNYSNNHIDLVVAVPGTPEWRITGFYGYSERSRRHEAWELLLTLKGRSTLPWVVMGDFNDLVSQSEKRGLHPHPENLLQGFCETLAECGLLQVHTVGYPFTWERGRGTREWVEERLDRVVAEERWCEGHLQARVYNIHTDTSDHSALLLDSCPQLEPRRRRSQFRFENAWLLDDGCKGVVEGAWEELAGVGFQERLRGCGVQLRRWGGDKHHRYIARPGKCVLATEAKQHWLRGADSNTKYYHKYASARRRKNRIVKLKDGDGRWVEGDGLNLVIVEYYKGIFLTNGNQIGDALDFIQPRVSQEQNDALLKPFQAEEVKEALFSMGPDKSPGPDGMNPGFYQSFWDVVGGDVTDFVLGCLGSGSFPDHLNDTNVVLIPKKQAPETVADLRPIALCNVVYKIMAKMLANRMKDLLGHIIFDESQSAFIPGRLISDNILVAVEVGHYLRRKQHGRVGWAALKLDMAKAYDRMEWAFLKGMMLRLGFPQAWVNLVMLTVTTVRYTIMVNGQPGGEEAHEVGRCLTVYEEVYGQAINYHKSSITFSHNTAGGDRYAVATYFRVVESTDFGKYLGLPSVIGKNKGRVFSYVEQKLRQRVGAWNKKFLTRAGKEVLLKSVAHAMPTFTMSVFLLPIFLCERLERCMNMFWWRNGNDGKGIHWLSWDKLCVPKCKGGLGFKQIHQFNVALLGKQGWRLLTNPHSLVARVFQARYYPKTTFLEATIGYNSSYCWRSILASQGMIKEGARKRVGNGLTTEVWGTPWLLASDNPCVTTDMPLPLQGTLVANLMTVDGRSWDWR